MHINQTVYVQIHFCLNENDLFDDEAGIEDFYIFCTILSYFSPVSLKFYGLFQQISFLHDT